MGLTTMMGSKRAVEGDVGRLRRYFLECWWVGGDEGDPTRRCLLRLQYSERDSDATVGRSVMMSELLLAVFDCPRDGEDEEECSCCCQPS